MIPPGRYMFTRGAPAPRCPIPAWLWRDAQVVHVHPRLCALTDACACMHSPGNRWIASQAAGLPSAVSATAAVYACLLRLEGCQSRASCEAALGAENCRQHVSMHGNILHCLPRGSRRGEGEREPSSRALHWTYLGEARLPPCSTSCTMCFTCAAYLSTVYVQCVYSAAL